mmetsp:Transcript_60183/g.97485  ORF Transcript_60183/g.97485 Transcript_60183/m.97485 type:complete len:235 (-) Transcript_60183:734-1438(-)
MHGQRHFDVLTHLLHFYRKSPLQITNNRHTADFLHHPSLYSIIQGFCALDLFEGVHRFQKAAPVKFLRLERFLRQIFAAAFILSEHLRLFSALLASCRKKICHQSLCFGFLESHSALLLREVHTPNFHTKRNTCDLFFIVIPKHVNRAFSHFHGFFFENHDRWNRDFDVEVWWIGCDSLCNGPLECCRDMIESTSIRIDQHHTLGTSLLRMMDFETHRYNTLGLSCRTHYNHND